MENIKEKLDPVVKQKILKALRSGKYTFTRDKLFEQTGKVDEDGDLIGKHCTVGVIFKEFGIPNTVLQYRKVLNLYDLPLNLHKCIGRFFTGQGIGVHTMAINDNDVSYAKAANWIEENL